MNEAPLRVGVFRRFVRWFVEQIVIDKFGRGVELGRSSVSLAHLNARIVDATSRGNLACVSCESHTPNTSDVGAIFASGSAFPFSTALNASWSSFCNSEQRTMASPARCPASRMFTVFSPAFTTICGTSPAYLSVANSGSIRFACEPTLSIKQTFVPFGSQSILYPPSKSSPEAKVGGNTTPSPPSTGISGSRMTSAAGPSSFNRLSNFVNSLIGHLVRE